MTEDYAMLNETIQYRKGYKYQLARAYRVSIGIFPETSIRGPYISLTKTGKLTITKGYAWDGASGPMKDTATVMRASLVHDALYQLMRNEKLPVKIWRKAADEEFRDIGIEDGARKIRMKNAYFWLRRFGRPAASPESRKPLITAP